MTDVSRKYANPPVTEALCEIYFEGSHWDSTIPGIFYQAIKERFPRKQELRAADIAVEIAGNAASTKVQPAEPRSRFLSEDESRMVQLGQDLLVVNQLRPYPRYLDWRPVVLETLELYRSLTSPAGISKFGVRYINKIEIPEAGHAMETYFDLYPEVPQSLGSAHGHFFLRLQIPAIHAKHALLVTFGTAGSETDGSSAYLLDLYDISSPNAGLEFDSVATRADEAHENIEHAFEHIITGNTRKLFGESK